MTKHLRFFMLTLLTIVCTVGGYSQTWEKVSLTDLTTDDVFVIVGTISNKTYALPNTETNKKPAAVAITISTDGNQITGDVTDNLKWNIEKSEEKYTFYPNGNKKAWLYSSSNSTDLGIGSTGTNKTFKYVAISSKQYEGLLNTSTNRYICIYSNKDWRAYTNNNIKATKISYYKYTTSSTSSATTTTFGTNSGKTFTFTNGKLEGFTAPKATATKSDDNTDLSNLIEYTSSDADIVTVNSKTGELKFTNTKFGKATITATLPKTDTYQTSTDSYGVENKDNHTATSLSFNGTDVTLTEGKTDAGTDFTGYTATEANNIAGTITYAASGDAVATVNPTTGAVTINATTYGTTTITATFTPADPTQYSGSTATYQITNQQKIDESTIVFDCSTYNQSLIGGAYDDNNNTPRQLKSVAGKDYTFTLTQCTFTNNSIQMAKTKKGKIVSPTFSSFPSGYKVVVTYDTDNTPQLYSAELTDAKAEVNTSLQTVSIELPSPTATFTIQSGTKYTQIKKIELSALIIKDNPALSFAEATVTKELVAGTIDLQTITKPEDLDPSAITYTSSDDATAKVEGNTIRLYKTGEVTITATSAATDKYAAGTASYKLVIEDNRTPDADFKFAAESYSEDLAKATDGIVTFNAANVLQNPHSLNVTYTISPESANATIGETDGKALIEVSGTYTITATGAANDTYKETTATCTLKVINSAVEEVSIEFVAGVDNGTGKDSDHAQNDDEMHKSFVKINSDNAWFDSTQKDNYRFYAGTHTISTKIGKITKIEFVGNNIINDKISNPLTNLISKDNNYTSTNPNYGVWVGSAKDVVFTNSKQARATNIIVTVEVPKAKNYTLDETKKDNVIETYENANVTLQRTLEASHWNSFCVPFALDKDQVTQYFGEGTQLRTYEGNCNNNIVYFATVDNIEAGKPYIMKPGNAVVKNPTFEGVSMVATGLDENGNPQAVGDASTVQMKGIYNHVTLVQDKTNIYIGAGNKFYYPADAEACQMNGLRAYFIVPEGTDIKKLRANLDGATTSLGEIFDTEESNTPVYNLQGQCVGNSLSTLKSGIYVQNGKKVVVK
ncbi:hypothetical protein [Leyella stercorea]|uniref:hypothetical protein n=2 Tax=Leyella stercorea TaxID=363265 RepID=UPI002FE3C83A